MNSEQQPGWCEALYRAKSPELLLYGRALGLSHGEAEDVLQDTFVALLQQAMVPENPDHYCLRAFRNRALNYRRSFWRQLARHWESREWFETSGEESPLEVAAMQALTHLPTLQREVVVLKVWHDYTFEQVADLLGISPNTAAGRYRYGMNRLRVLMKVKETHDERVGNHYAFVEAVSSFRTD